MHIIDSDLEYKYIHLSGSFLFFSNSKIKVNSSLIDILRFNGSISEVNGLKEPVAEMSLAGIPKEMTKHINILLCSPYLAVFLLSVIVMCPIT